jgi:tetratricopeptide (TPR) repeat protein
MSEQSTVTTGLSPQTLALSRAFSSALRERRTGAVVAWTDDGRRKGFLFRDGALEDIDTGTDLSLLCRALLATGRVNPKLLKKAEKTALREGRSTASVLLGWELVPEDDLVNAIEEAVTAEVVETFTWEISGVEFRAPGPHERIEGFTSELREHFELSADPEEILIDAAQELDAWELVEHGFPLLRDVYYATPAAMRHFRDRESFPSEVQLLSQLDGSRDAGEAIAASQVNPFEALRVVRQLIQRADIELVTASQFYHLGSQQRAAGDLEKACRCFRRSWELGFRGFDVELRVADALADFGQRSESADWRLRFARSCLDQLRVDEAIAGLKAVTDEFPQRLDALELLLEVYVDQKRSDAAIEFARRLARHWMDSGDHSKALTTIKDLSARFPHDVAVRKCLIEIAEACGDSALAHSERESLARSLDEREESGEALEVYQRLFCTGTDSQEVRLKLLRLHRQLGHHRKAVEHLHGLFSLGGAERVTDPELLLDLHETLVELDPAEFRSRRWLVKHHMQRGEKDEAAAVLKSWLPELEKRGDPFQIRSAIEQLLELEDALDHRWTLVAVLERLGLMDESQRRLRELAQRAGEQGDPVQAERAWERVIREAPFDAEARRSKVAEVEAQGKRAQAAGELRDLADLERLRGRSEAVRDCYERAAALAPESAATVEALGNDWLRAGEIEKGAACLVRVARLHREQRNLGLAGCALRGLLRSVPDHAEAKAMLQEIERLEVQDRSSLQASTQGGGPQPQAAPIAASGSSRGAERDPFQQAATATTTVAGITAKLRSLQSGGQQGGIRAAQRSGAVKVQSIAQRLRALKGTEGAADSSGGISRADPGAQEAPPAPAPAPAAPGTLRNAAMVLKALRESRQSTVERSRQSTVDS